MNTIDNTVNPQLTPIPRQRRRDTVENSEYAKFAQRILRAYARRVGDQADIEALADLVALANVIDDAISSAVRGLRKANPPYSWAEIGRPVGISKQAAQQRWGGDQ
jgi:hypothetical protein